jgi:hypothetical protein
MTTAPERTPLKCTCCGKEILAELVDREAIVVRGMRHGRSHVLVIKLDQFLPIVYSSHDLAQQHPH